jgi:hypothetical protein
MDKALNHRRKAMPFLFCKIIAFTERGFANLQKNRDATRNSNLKVKGRIILLAMKILHLVNTFAPIGVLNDTLLNYCRCWRNEAIQAV